MAESKNVVRIRQKKLAHYLVVEGLTKAAAYRKAGYTGESPGAVDLAFSRPQVQKYIEQELKRLEKKFELTRDWVVERLMRIADSPAILAKFKKVDADGSIGWDFTGATEEDMKYINGLMTETYLEGRGAGAKAIKKFKVEISDPKAALDSLARLLGLFQDNTNISVKEDVINRLREGRIRAAAERIEKDPSDSSESERDA